MNPASCDMFSGRRSWSLAFISIPLIAAALIVSAPPYTLRIIESADGRDLAAIPVVPGDRVEVSYTHSMFLVPQIEIFSIRPDGLFHLENIAFGSLAAALYYDPDPPQRLMFQGNMWVLGGDGKNYPILKYRVSAGTGHVLIVKDQRIDLSKRTAAPGMPVLLNVEERPRIMAALANLWKILG